MEVFEEDYHWVVRVACPKSKGKRDLLNLKSSINYGDAISSSRCGKGKAHVMQCRVFFEGFRFRGFSVVLLGFFCGLSLVIVCTQRRLTFFNKYFISYKNKNNMLILKLLVYSPCNWHRGEVSEKNQQWHWLLQHENVESCIALWMELGSSDYPILHPSVCVWGEIQWRGEDNDLEELIASGRWIMHSQSSLLEMVYLD